MLIVQILIISVLSAIFIQDLKSRSVYWFWFPLLTGLLIVDIHMSHHQSFKWQSAIINLLFISLQLLLVTVYFSVKHRQWINISKELLGWGDILFLGSVAFYFSVLNYLFFYIISLIIICIFWIFLRILSRKNYQHIPLAGLQAMILILLLIIELLNQKIDFTSDNWLLPYIYK